MSIEISQKHGVNPSIEQCFYCMKDMGVVLFGKLKGDEEAPRRVCLDKKPCTECKEYMEQGIILISVDGKLTDDLNNPWRSGGWVVLKEEAIKRIITDEKVLADVLKKRVTFVPDEVWDALGLPRKELPKEED